MFNVLIDTSVWLDLAQDQKQTPLLEPLIGLIEGGSINALVPRIVLEEFQKIDIGLPARGTQPERPL
jgi:hypothetical protein